MEIGIFLWFEFWLDLKLEFVVVEEDGVGLKLFVFNDELELDEVNFVVDCDGILFWYFLVVVIFFKILIKEVGEMFNLIKFNSILKILVFRVMLFRLYNLSSFLLRFLEDVWVIVIL